jgi:hypothetical protein
MRHNAGQINGCFNARITTPNDRCALALEQGAIAMRAVSHTLVFVVLFARHIHIAPASTR